MLIDLEFDVVPSSLYVAIGAKEYKRQLNSMGWDSDNFHGGAISSYGKFNGKYVFIIGIKKKEKDNIGILCHEVNHTIEYMFEAFGYTDRHEFKSYMFEYIINEITHAIKESNKK